MNVIGLGKAGCNIADTFAKYPQYNIYKIDVGLKGDNCYSIKKQESPEEYEKNTPSFKTFFKGLEGDSLFVVGGSGNISAMCLSIMEQIREKAKIDVLYIKPDTFMLNQTKTHARESNLQCFATVRSLSAINGILMVSNPQLETF
jgi:hypothetical protein